MRKAVVKQKATVFALQFFLFSLLIGLIFFLCTQLFVFLEKKGYFSSTPLFAPEDYFYYNLLVFVTVGIFVNLCFCGLRFFEENLKMQKGILESQLHSLQKQITPHFMFNVLNHINILMQSDVDLASSLLIKYSDILRYQLYSGKREYILLEQEIEFLKNFIDVEKIRWEDKLLVSCSWKIENDKKEIPPLLFITFIENAFKHVSRTASENGYVKIDFEQSGNIIQSEVKNSKSVIPAKRNENSGLGLENVKKRLDILYRDSYELSTEETDTDSYVKLIIRDIK